MGVWNQRAFCPNCGAKIHTHDSSLIPGTRRTGTECPNCGAKLSGKVSFGNKAVLAGQKSDGEQVAALLGKGISAGGRAIERRRLQKATGIEVGDPADFQKLVAEEVADSSSVIVQPTKKTVRLSMALREAGVEVDMADLLEQAKEEGDEEAPEEVADASGVIVQQTKVTSKLQRALLETGLKVNEVSDLQKQIKTGPIEVRPDSSQALKTFVAKLKKLGTEYELTDGRGNRNTTRAEEPASDLGERKIRTGTEVHPISHAALETLVAKLKKLGIEYELMHDRDMSRPERFDVVVSVPAEVLKTLREKKAKELKDQLGLEKREVGHAQQLIRDWEVKPDEPSVVAAGILEKFADETKALMEKLGARAELVPAAQGNGDEGQTETDTGKPQEDMASQSPASPESSPGPSEGVLAQIEKLGQLHHTGVLTDEEFQAKKSELLQRL